MTTRDPTSLTQDARVVVLPGGQSLVLRPASPDDVDGLLRLHQGLTLDDLYQRSSLIARPKRQQLERMVTTADRGGHALVATVRESGRDTGRPVGAVAYELLGDGNGEMALVVAPEWRQWLGRLLLHAILEAAAGRGVPNLESDVLLANQPLLALARARGCAFRPSTVPWSVRVVIGTRGPTPTWTGPHDRPRVLVETPTGRWPGADAALAAGWELMVCPGPRERPCPALVGQVCALVAAADAVVVATTSPDGRWDALRDAHPDRHPGVPICGSEVEVEVVDRVARAHARQTDAWVGDLVSA